MLTTSSDLLYHSDLRFNGADANEPRSLMIAPTTTSAIEQKSCRMKEPRPLPTMVFSKRDRVQPPAVPASSE